MKEERIMAMTTQQVIPIKLKYKKNTKNISNQNKYEI